jgi:hypothetical protein
MNTMQEIVEKLDFLEKSMKEQLKTLRSQRRWIYTADELPPVGEIVQCLWFFQEADRMVVESGKARMSHGSPMPEFWQAENHVERIRPVLWAPVEVPDVGTFARRIE